MQSRISEVLTPQPLGGGRTRCLLEIPSGGFAGRRAILFLSAPDTMQLSWADTPYLNWSTPQTIATGCDDGAFDALMLADGDIIVAYQDDATDDLVTTALKLGEDGTYVPQPTVTVFSGDVNLSPSLAVEAGGRLWICWQRYVPGLASLYVKSSDDSGATWGAGPSDPGDQLHSGGMSAMAQLTVTSASLYATYFHSGDQFSMRSRPLASGDWSAASLISSGSSVSSNFVCATRSDGLLAAAWVGTDIYYREFDGVAWGATEQLIEDPVGSLQLFFQDTVPHIVYSTAVGTDAVLLRYVHRQSGVFSDPCLLDPRNDAFADVLAYCNNDGTFADLGSAAASSETADMVHPTTGALISQKNDAVFLGMDVPFRLVRLQLSTAGSGGAVSYSYWDGSLWRAFAPEGGAVNLDIPNPAIEFWPDYNAIPTDWQKRSVDGRLRFWVKIEVVSGYTQPPVGSSANAITDANYLHLGG